MVEATRVWKSGDEMHAEMACECMKDGTKSISGAEVEQLREPGGPRTPLRRISGANSMHVQAAS